MALARERRTTLKADAVVVGVPVVPVAAPVGGVDMELNVALQQLAVFCLEDAVLEIQARSTVLGRQVGSEKVGVEPEFR